MSFLCITVTEALVQYFNETPKYFDPDPVWYIDGRFLLSLAAVFLILPWLFIKKIGILSYTRFANRHCPLEERVAFT